MSCTAVRTYAGARLDTSMCLRIARLSRYTESARPTIRSCSATLKESRTSESGGRRMMWKPNGLLITGLTSPGPSCHAASSNACTYAPRVERPSDPPCVLEPGSSEYRVASCAKRALPLLLGRDAVGRAGRDLEENVLEDPLLTRVVGRIHLLRREIAARGDLVVEAIPLERGDHRPHRRHDGRRVAQVVPGGELLREQRVIDPDVRDATQRDRVERHLLAAAGPFGDAIDAQRLVVRARHLVRPRRERIPQGVTHPRRPQDRGSQR